MTTRIVPLTEIKGVIQVQETDTKSPDYGKVIRLEFVNPGTQTRAGINPDRVEYMAQHFDELKPIVLFDDGTWKWPGAGHHRISAAILTGTCPKCGNRFEDVAEHVSKEHKDYQCPETFKTRNSILADVRPGTERDALAFSLTDNIVHDKEGAPRSGKDMDTSVAIMMSDPEWSDWTNQKIADHLHVKLWRVKKYAHLRAHLGRTDQDSRTVTRGGKKYAMKTGKIGRKRRKSADERLAEMTTDEAKAAIDKGKQVCLCTCAACMKCKNKPKKR